ncbi:replication protein [Tetragenococcus halophilus]|uniref:DnaD domain-containing protein n=1 Tax=Tetragenococcus muriaticus PMC-11-5 TaxID=1302649 RepID=A0A091CBQ4_9ENTE|nr:MULTISPECIES: hypothetical protein [Tetragenococcus]KFN88988.1 hypothetical protein TMUPMC115_2634 [Tetragenococcus muriaticus PMC-11-5]MCO7026831.1 replication protein [Tetragenococcus halophilus]
MADNLLINEYPLLVLPNLAKEIGLNEAIFIQQLHYWLNGKSAKLRDGKTWVYNTYEDWQEQFPFWSVPTIKRIVNKLREKKLIITKNYNKFKYDKTLWYSINYDELHKIEQSSYQIDTIEEDKKTPPIPEITSEITNNTGQQNKFAYLLSRSKELSNKQIYKELEESSLFQESIDNYISYFDVPTNEELSCLKVLAFDYEEDKLSEAIYKAGEETNAKYPISMIAYFLENITFWSGID